MARTLYWNTICYCIDIFVTLRLSGLHTENIIWYTYQSFQKLNNRYNTSQFDYIPKFLAVMIVEHVGFTRKDFFHKLSKIVAGNMLHWLLSG